MPSEVWANTVDGGRWSVRVDGDDADPYKGTLTVADDQGAVVHREAVGISYGAPFGADAFDVEEWTTRCLDVIDNPDKRKVMEIEV